jgi:hypothetical protein
MCVRDPFFCLGSSFRVRIILFRERSFSTDDLDCDCGGRAVETSAPVNAGLAATRRDYFAFTGGDFLESSIFERRTSILS